MPLFNIRISTATLMASALVMAPASATAVEIVNPSFEDQVLADGDFINAYGPLGWSGGLASPTGPINPTAATFASVPDGENVMYSATGNNGDRYQGTNWQQVSSTIAGNTRYTLLVDVGRALGGDMADFAVEFASGPGYDGNVPIVFAATTFARNSIAAGDFQTLALTYDALVPSNVGFGIRFRTFYDPLQGTDQRVTYFDNVRLDAASIAAVDDVPEPASWAMMITGFGVTGAALRRRWRSSLLSAATLLPQG